jgi:predicted permease
MTSPRRLIAGVKALFRGRRVERELDEELRAYLETSIEEKMRAGMARGEASRAARVEMGGLETVKDHVRDVGWETRVESVGRDVRYAVRALRKSPGFTFVAVLTLALGIGATTAIFSLLDAVMFKSLPVRDPGQLVLVGGSQYPVFQAFRQHADIFEDLLATSGITPLDVETPHGVRERTAVSLVSGSYFSTLGVQAAIGRVFAADDDRVAGAHPIAVASHGFWQRRLGRDAVIPGPVVRINGTAITIIGVAPPGFFGEQVGVSPDLWVPLTMWGQVVPGRNLLQNPGTGWLRMIGRVRPEVSLSAPQPELTQTFRRVVTEIFGPNMPDDVRRDTERAIITLEPAGNGLSTLRAQFGRSLRLVMAAVVLVLLVACANIANLLLARATARRRETDVRLALGMSRARLVQQLLTESLVLAALGGAAGLALAWLGREALLRLISADGSRLPLAVATDARLLVFVVMISTGTAILFGLAPAWRSARANLVTSLVSRREGSVRSQRLGSLLVVAQVACSLVLLMGAGLFLRTIANLREVNLGFAPERLLVVEINPQTAGYRSDRAVTLSGRLLDRITELPGVSSVSLSEHGVLTGTDNSTNLMRAEGVVAGPDGFPRTRWDVVGPRYFSTIGAQVISGRDFSERDNAASPLVVAINEAMGRLFFGDASPIGRRLVWDVSGRQKAFEIVGVTRDVKQRDAREQPPPRFYLPYLQIPEVRATWVLASTRFLVRTAGDPAAIAPAVREQIRSEDPRLSVTSLDVAPELVSRTLVRERMLATLLIAFGALALALASIGLYGVLAYAVVRRTNEIGIRLALGARRSQVLALILSSVARMLALGIALGLAGAWAISRAVTALLFGVTPGDPLTIAVAIIILVVTGLLAAYLPARRGTRIEPLRALRCD